MTSLPGQPSLKFASSSLLRRLSHADTPSDPYHMHKEQNLLNFHLQVQLHLEQGPSDAKAIYIPSSLIQFVQFEHKCSIWKRSNPEPAQAETKRPKLGLKLKIKFNGAILSSKPAEPSSQSKQVAVQGWCPHLNWMSVSTIRQNPDILTYGKSLRISIKRNTQHLAKAAIGAIASLQLTL